MDNFKFQLSKQLRHIDGLIAALLFGSQSQETAREDSDVDIALYFRHEACPTPLELIELRETCVDLINKEVDCVCLNTASPIIAMQVYKHGEILVMNDNAEYQKFLMRLFTDYADLKTLRKPLEDNILSRRLYD